MPESVMVRTRFLARGVLGLVSMAMLLFLCSGRLRWKAAWAQLGIRLAAHVATASLVAGGLIEERSQTAHHDQESWDRAIFKGFGLISARIIPALAGLDVRFGRTSKGRGRGRRLAACLFVASNCLWIWAMKTNRFFSTVVRIQGDRCQSVASSGPYRYVRHPGYAALILQTIAAPLMLGSPSATVAGVIGALLLVLRTILEDRFLQRALPGYQGYAEQVRWRLIPRVW